MTPVEESNETELLKALSASPQKMTDIAFSKSSATKYRTLKSLLTKKWVESIEGRNYAMTSLGRRALELLHV